MEAAFNVCGCFAFLRESKAEQSQFPISKSLWGASEIAGTFASKTDKYGLSWMFVEKFSAIEIKAFCAIDKTLLGGSELIFDDDWSNSSFEGIDFNRKETVTFSLH